MEEGCCLGAMEEGEQEREEERRGAMEAADCCSHFGGNGEGRRGRHGGAATRQGGQGGRPWCR